MAAELAEVIADFKARAAAAVLPEEMWAIEEHLNAKRHEIDEKYIYRYTRLILVFGHLLREGRIQEAQLAGLSAEKLKEIRRVASY